MARLGHDVTLHVRPGNREIDNTFEFYGVEPCFRVLTVNRPQIRVWGAFVNAWKTKKLVLGGSRPDLLYAREYWALLLLRNSGIPFIFESHWKPKSVVHHAVETKIMQHPKCRRIVLISNALREIYGEEFPWLCPSQVVVAHDGADAVSPKPKSFRELGRDGVLQVGYVGSFQVGAGIETVAEISHKMPEFDFHVVGGSEKEVQNLVRSLPDLPNLHIHGFMKQALLTSAYSGFDVMLAPYQENTTSIDWCSPMKLFEYMAHGKAIICSDYPVMREIIEDGTHGLLVPADDLEAWVTAISSLSDRERRASLGEAGRARLEKKFTWDIRARRVLEGVV
jgi:glycosyltransferase involved in cell wall biosynthesis